MTRADVLRAFQSRITHPVSAREFIQLLKIPREHRVGVRRQLRALATDGSLVVVRGHRYGLPGRADLIVGRLTMHPDGYGFVKPEAADLARSGDVYVPGFALKTAMHGDRVTVQAGHARADGRREGRVMRVLSRANDEVIGRFELDVSGRPCVVPYDRRLGSDVRIDGGETAGASPGQVVVAAVTHWPTATRGPVGHVVEVLGTVDDPGVDTRIVIRKHHLPDEHGPDAVAEAVACGEAVRPEDLEGRTDFRTWDTVTIDGEDARDFDDAISLDVVEGGTFRLAVHIADVSYYVREGSALDHEAADRGTSVYFPERAVHMLPEPLAAGLCSLKPGVDRLVQSCVMDIGRDGTVGTATFHDGVIRSDARLTYGEVNAILTVRDPEACARRAPLVPLIDRMRDAFERLHARRRARGAIDFDLPQPAIVLDASGLVETILPAERNVAHRIIEEFMLAANETVARELASRDVATVYRVHDAPDPFKVEEFATFAAALGFRFEPSRGGVRPRDFQALVEQIKGAPEEKPAAFLMLRTMQLARYDQVNGGHFGLALETYTHFTSPIRRYPDLLVHRHLRLARAGRAATVDDHDAREQVAAAARQCSERERRAVDAERELVQWKKARFMADKVGEVFDGVITGVAPFGFFVELAEHFVEGLVHVSTLADDFYRLDDGAAGLRGVHAGASFRLGDRVRVQVARVNLDRHLVELDLVSSLETTRPRLAPAGPDAGGQRPRKATHDHRRPRTQGKTGDRAPRERSPRARGERGRREKAGRARSRGRR
jgi:ribonuclease R